MQKIGSRSLFRIYIVFCLLVFTLTTPAEKPLKFGTATTIQTDDPDPSLIGQSYSVTVSVITIEPNLPSPTGFVTVSDGAGATCTIGMTTSSCSLISTVAGVRTLTARYSGDANFDGSSSQATHTVIGSPPAAVPQLEGTWEVESVLTNCQGLTLQSFSKIVSFNAGGTAQETSTGAPSSQRTVALGGWQRNQGNSFRYFLKFFRFDPAGAYINSTRAVWTVSLAQQGDSYTATGQIQVTLPNGVVASNLCGAETGTRFN